MAKPWRRRSTCMAANPVSDAYATAAIKKISQNLLVVLDNPKDENARLELAQASTMAGVAFSNAMVGLVHSLGHATGAVAHLPHGLCMSLYLPYVLEYNLDKNGARIADLLLPLAGALAALLMAIAIRCRSVKEAQANATVVVLLVSLLPLLTLFGRSGEAPWHLWMPVLAQTTLMARVLKGESMAGWELLLPLVVCTLLGALCLAFVARTLRHSVSR